MLWAMAIVVVMNALMQHLELIGTAIKKATNP